MKYSNRIRQAQSTSCLEKRAGRRGAQPETSLKRDARHPREGPRPQQGAGLAGAQKSGRGPGPWSTSGSRAGVSGCAGKTPEATKRRCFVDRAPHGAGEAAGSKTRKAGWGKAERSRSPAGVQAAGSFWRETGVHLDREEQGHKLSRSRRQPGQLGRLLPLCLKQFLQAR